MTVLIFMKPLIGLLASLALATPVMAEIDPTDYKTYHAMGCMLVRDCQDGVTKVSSAEEVAAFYPGRDFGRVTEELNVLFELFELNGIEVFVAEGKYFPRLHRGVYSTEYNKFYLNVDYMYDPETVLSVTRHEGWHAAQDCMAGSLQNTSIAIIHHDGYIPQSYQMRADIAYGGGHVVPWEAEAMWAGETPMVTAEALRACAGPGKIWETYDPTPLTREWLVKQGYITE